MPLVSIFFLTLCIFSLISMCGCTWTLLPFIYTPPPYFDFNIFLAYRCWEMGGRPISYALWHLHISTKPFHKMQKHVILPSISITFTLYIPSSLFSMWMWKCLPIHFVTPPSIVDDISHNIWYTSVAMCDNMFRFK